MSGSEPPPLNAELDIERWMETHNAFVHESREKEPDVLFLGDSLVALLEQSDVFLDLFTPLHSLCFGIMGDTSEHLIWRINNGELDSIRPKVIVVSIGSCDRCEAPSTAANIQQIVHKIRQKQPSAHLMMLKLLPSGRKKNPRREFSKSVNELLEENLSDSNEVTLVNCDPGFASSTDGSIHRHDMFDFFHLSRDGYRKAFDLVYAMVMGVIQPDEDA